MWSFYLTKHPTLETSAADFFLYYRLLSELKKCHAATALSESEKHVFLWHDTFLRIFISIG